MNYLRRLIQFSLNYCSRFIKYFLLWLLFFMQNAVLITVASILVQALFFSCAVAVTIFLIIMIIALIVHWICGNDNDNIKGNSTN